MFQVRRGVSRLHDQTCILLARGVEPSRRKRRQAAALQDQLIPRPSTKRPLAKTIVCFTKRLLQYTQRSPSIDGVS